MNKATKFVHCYKEYNNIVGCFHPCEDRNPESITTTRHVIARSASDAAIHNDELDVLMNSIRPEKKDGSPRYARDDELEDLTAFTNI